jgi:hypothetical protein
VWHAHLAVDATITLPPALPPPASLVNPCNPHAAQKLKRFTGKAWAMSFNADVMEQQNKAQTKRTSP